MGAVLVISGIAQVVAAFALDASADSRVLLNPSVIGRLGLKPENVDETKSQIRYTAARLDWELTKLEGAQCEFG